VLRSLYISLIYLSFLILGTSAPFILSLGYVWVDTFTPQAIAYVILPSIPVSLIMAIAAVGGYIFWDRKSPPQIGVFTVLIVCFAAWVTLSTFLWATVPEAAFAKWDSAVKVIMFSAFIPLVFRSKVQIESFLQIYLLSLSVQFLPTGIKTMISGGGYGRELGIVSGNSGLSEGSTLAAVSLMLIPIIFYLRKNTILLKKSFGTDAVYIGLAIAAVAAAIGTYERTALVGMIVVACGLWLRSKRKVLGVFIGILAFGAIISLVSEGWTSRIGTTTDFAQENSALGRVLVWQWTLDFVSGHPEGGGFDVYRTDRIVFPGTVQDPEPLIVHGKAFHSVYFEVLGEQGWVGLCLFIGLSITTFSTLQAIARRSRGDVELSWARELAYALQVSLLTLLTCGAFIGIAFQPMIYYLFAISASLRHCVRQMEDARDPMMPRQRYVPANRLIQKV
jgi:putative inorganic carbon (hco3(-)) transporter